ncbi:Eco57I restriction-modification methylase domain-containing protein [Alcaligenes aquatilis]|uniref:Eco57I restriction-modification methylase domain-containing protein n=1 Tax=Alcaligenes aquatilis TaxID=323284 RepID=UPI003619F5CE
MSLHAEGWAQLRHGGLLISPAKLDEFFPDPAAAMSDYQAEKLRRALTAFDGSSETLGNLLDYILQDLSGLPAEEWQKAQAVDSRWAVRSFTGAQIKPRRLWLGPNGETLAVFTPDDSGSRQFASRLGVGRSKQLLGRVVEWLRRTGQALALVTNGRQWRLVHAGADYEAWCEWDIELWFSEGQPAAQTLIWRTLLNRSTLLAEQGQNRLLQAISASRKGQAELSNVLGERVRQGVEELITASHVAIEQAQQQGQAHDYKDLYVAGSRIIMRCIITLFAEARGLMPVDNPIYQQAYSLEGLRHQLDRRAGGRGNERLSQGRSAWPRLISLFNLIHEGSAHERLSVPQYGGALFEPGNPASDDGISRALALLESSQNLVSDLQVHKLLRLLTRTKMKVRQGRSSRWVDAPVDFSTLSSEYIGILYEGLLDFELKQAADNDPVIFLAVGNQPALTLSQLEAMDDKAIKQLFEALKKKDSTGDDSDDEADEGVEESADLDDSSDEEADAVEDDSEEDTNTSDDSEELTLSEDHLLRANTWLQHAAQIAGLVKKPRGRKANTAADEAQQALEKAAKQLCARIVAPGQFFLVRWGGTRKGAGTFYTRPQLAAPTVRRTLQPLAYDAVQTETDPRTGLDSVVEWAPKTPEQILALKVCDPAMGSGSFLAGALRYLTEALTQSLFHHKLIERSEDGGVPRMADGKLTELLSDELTKLNPKDDGFEEALRAQLKRHIVERCLYGVDLDPLAVELGRMALWVETMDRDLPFGFLDHKLKVGNALVGTWFDTYRDYPAMAWQREGGDKDYQKNKPDNLINHWYEDAKGKRKGDVFTDAIKARAKAVPEQLQALLSGQLTLEGGLDAGNVHDELLKVFRKLHRLPVHESEKRAEIYQQEVLNNPHYHALKARMDLWCALWFWPGEQIELAPLPRDFANPGEQALAIAAEVARRQRFFHWELEFPDVFTASQDGFDALLGNPPWETMQPNSKEFFSNHDPLYRAYGKQDALAKQLEYFCAWPQLEHDWIAYMAGFKAFANWMNAAGKPFGDRVTEDKDGKKKHDLNLGGRGKNSFEISATVHKKWLQQRKKHKGFADTAHPFIHQGSGKPYLQKMFLELSHALLRKQGRLGMIVPSGIYTDKGTTDLRELFLGQCDWQWLFGFENREKVFDIDSRFKFCPLIVQKDGQTQAIRAAFMHRNVDDWEQAERHVLAYPRARVEEFSPYSKAILEIRSEQDLRVLQKIYANGVLLGDQSENGWGIKYQQGDFNMTSDSKLFPPRPKWEEKSYRPDEYGHWLKGPWHEYRGPQHILEREPGLVLSRDGQQALRVDEIEDVALPLYEGRMIGQFDFSEKGWVSGKARSAVWRDIPAAEKTIEPQYLMALTDYYEGSRGGVNRFKVSFMDVTSATNKRTMIASAVGAFPCNHKTPTLTKIGTSPAEVMSLVGVLNSFVYDYSLRLRQGGQSLIWGALEETPVIEKGLIASEVGRLAASLNLVSHLFDADYWVNVARNVARNNSSLHKCWALTTHEQIRLRSLIDALAAFGAGLSWDDYLVILAGSDLSLQSLSDTSLSRLLDPKGFWRIDKDKDPELRHTVLSLVAFHDLQQKGLEAFLAQNDGEGWMIPEQLRLADYGLGHDQRAQEYQPVASRLGPRFYDWQLNEDVERSWQECAAHAELIRRIVPLPEPEPADGAPDARATNKNESPQGALF